MQNSEFQQNEDSINFKLGSMTGIDLEVLWTRYGRF